MLILITSFIAFLVGLFLFIYALPKISAFFTWWIKTSERIDKFQKLSLLNFIDHVKDGDFKGKSPKNVQFLSMSLFVLLALQHYFLFVRHGIEAGLVVGGMFLMLGAHILVDG